MLMYCISIHGKSKRGRIMCREWERQHVDNIDRLRMSSLFVKKPKIKTGKNSSEPVELYENQLCSGEDMCVQHGWMPDKGVLI